MPRIVATGCGRAGTQYLTRLLVHCGLRAAHEGVFRYDLDPTNPPKPEDVEPRWVFRDPPEGPGGPIDVDVSWMAAPFLVKSLPRDCVVWHQTRDLLKVARCWRQHDLAGTGVVSEFVQRSLPGLDNGTDSLPRSVQYVFRWNKMVERAALHRPYVRYRVEELSPAVLNNLLAWSGFEVPFPIIEQAFNDAGTGVGSCPYPHQELTWSQVLCCFAPGAELTEMALRYGYEVAGAPEPRE